MPAICEEPQWPRVAKVSATASMPDEEVIREEPGIVNRKYEVRGVNDIDDVHVFRTDHQDRAEEMLDLMSEDLEDVELVEMDLDLEK